VAHPTRLSSDWSEQSPSPPIPRPPSSSYSRFFASPVRGTCPHTQERPSPQRRLHLPPPQFPGQPTLPLLLFQRSMAAASTPHPIHRRCYCSDAPPPPVRIGARDAKSTDVILFPPAIPFFFSTLSIPGGVWIHYSLPHPHLPDTPSVSDSDVPSTTS